MSLVFGEIKYKKNLFSILLRIGNIKNVCKILRGWVMKHFLHMLTGRKNVCWEPAFEYLWVVFYRVQTLRCLTSSESLVFDANG